MMAGHGGGGLYSARSVRPIPSAFRLHLPFCAAFASVATVLAGGGVAPVWAADANVAPRAADQAVEPPAGPATTASATPPGLLTPAQSCRIVGWNRAARSGLRPADDADKDLRLFLEADRLSGETGISLQAEGQAQLRRGRLSLQAERFEYRFSDDRVRASGGVQLWRDQDYYSGSEIELDTERAEGYFIAPRFHFARTQASGGAERIDFLGKNRLSVLGATYSSCEVAEGETPPWELSARRVQLDFNANDGLAEGGVLRFFGVPILAWPVLSFPVTDERKSGFLPPLISIASTSGLELGLPFYWNIAPDQDATVTPVLSLKRGMAFDGEYRYLRDSWGGMVHGSLLPHDRINDSRRWAFGWTQSGGLIGDWDYDWHLLRVSDDAYWTDGLRGATSLTPRLLNSQGQLRQRSTLQLGVLGEIDQWLYAGVQRWQVLQSLVASDTISAPYQRAPQLGAQWRSQHGGLSGSLQGELNQFTRVQDGLLTGSRAHLLGEIGWQHGEGGWLLTPRIAFNAAAYDTVQPMSDGRSRASRVIPTFSLDSSWNFDRPIRLFGRALTQTLEPRLLYVRTPWRDLTNLPNFDSARLDFNTNSLFSVNAFSGVDWVSEAKQLTLGVSSRFLDAGSGAQLATLGIAQRYVLRGLQDTPDARPPSTGFSDLFAVGSINAIPHWGLDTSVQYNSDTRRIERSISSVNYSPGPFRTVSISHRLQREASEQLALGWQWPLRGPTPLLVPSPAQSAVQVAADGTTAPHRASVGNGSQCEGTLYGVGRLDYSMRDRRISGAIAGLEYDAGCWIGRVVAARTSTGSSAATTKLMLQLELVGLSRLGSNPLGVLKDNIPGYTLLRDPKADYGLAPGSPSGSSGASTLP
jgi:LPS-assembly protein